MAILCIDGMNFLHRSRSGFQMGPAPVIFNFMRNFRSLIEQFKPSRVYFVLEGKPQQRKDILPEYKANRAVVEGSVEAVERDKFFVQADEIVSLLKIVFPISVVRHPRFECDDTIYNLIKRSSTAVEWIVVSNDTDFTQLLNEFQHVKIWNPMKKTYVETPEYDYVLWKALRGDGSDNIPGVPGVGDKTALELVSNLESLSNFLLDPDKASVFTRNVELIKFIEWSTTDMMEMTSSSPTHDWNPLKDTFEKYGFNSLLKDDAWNKFTNTFCNLWG
jgi:DNA polymerase-1